MKRTSSLVLALILCVGLCVPASAADFSDVPADHAFHDAISYCAEKGIVGGYSDGTFRPANTLSRSNFTVLLSRAFFADDVAAYNTPAYLNNGQFYPNYVAMMMNSALRYVSFEDFISADMNAGISRYDMAQLMTNIMSNKGFAASDPDKNAAIAKIADYADIPSQYQDAVLNVYALGVIGGFSDGSFGGTATMNRGQAAVVIHRLAQYIGSDSGTVLDPSADSDLTEVPNTPNNTPDPVTPVDPDTKPETPNTSGRTLANGKAITEANVTEILNQLKAKYPQATDFSGGYAGLGSGRSYTDTSIAQVTNQYWRAANHSQHTGLYGGCGGWAAFVADEIFGQTGVTWKKTTIANARPGDLMIDLDSEGYLGHVSIYVSEAAGWDKTQKVYSTDATGNPYKITWSKGAPQGSYATVDVYTAYPD